MQWGGRNQCFLKHSRGLRLVRVKNLVENFKLEDFSAFKGDGRGAVSSSSSTRPTTSRKYIKLVINKMSIVGVGDSRDDSSVDTEHSTASRRNASFISELPSMQSPASNASTCDDASHETNHDASIEISEHSKLADEYDPVDIELETPSKISPPQYISSVMEINPRIDSVGTTTLDEPMVAIQSNKTVVEVQPKNATRNQPCGAVAERTTPMSNAINTDAIDQWIRSLEEKHSTKQHLTKNVTSQNKIDFAKYQIRREVADEINNGSVHMPPADIDLSVEEYARMLCSLFGIPVHDVCIVESVHILLGLFVELERSDAAVEAY